MADHVCNADDFDRTICPPPCDQMHFYCTVCGARQDYCAHDKLFDFLLGTENESETFAGLLPELASVLPVIRAAQADAFDEGVEATLNAIRQPFLRKPDNPYQV